MSDAHEESPSTRLKRLKYQSGYRGTKELDILMGRFAEAALETLSAEDLNDYEVLLTDVEETELYLWLTKQQEPPPAYKTPVFQKLMAFLYA